MIKNIFEGKKALSYLKVGSFFTIGFILFFITLLSMKNVSFLKGSYPIVVTFEFGEGLRAASPVRFCGVDIGEVNDVSIRERKGRPLVFVKTHIQEDIKIPRDSRFIINSLSLFGEKYLEIIPPEEVKSYLVKGEVVEGISPIPLFSVFANFTKTMKEVSAFVKEGEIKTSLENSLANIESLTANLNGLIDDTKNKSGTVGRLFYDDSLYQVTEEFIKELKDNPWKLLHKPREQRRR
ncbi:MAG: MCE family protein [Candidatus Omnitrophica bacterium]|nr:MCE family protein [Candidatus Omnitrophota bacterium]